MELGPLAQLPTALNARLCLFNFQLKHLSIRGWITDTLNNICSLQQKLLLLFLLDVFHVATFTQTWKRFNQKLQKSQEASQRCLERRLKNMSWYCNCCVDNNNHIDYHCHHRHHRACALARGQAKALVPCCLAFDASLTFIIYMWKI